MEFEKLREGQEIPIPSPLMKMFNFKYQIDNKLKTSSLFVTYVTIGTFFDRDRLTAYDCNSLFSQNVALKLGRYQQTLNRKQSVCRPFLHRHRYNGTLSG